MKLKLIQPLQVVKLKQIQAKNITSSPEELILEGSARKVITDSFYQILESS